MALVLVIFLRVLFCLVTQGSLIDESPLSQILRNHYLHSQIPELSQSISYNISLGTSLSTHTNSSWLSPSGIFAFGFYQQDNGFAVGIWLTTKPEITVVWTANRDDPPLSSNSTIEFDRDGWLLLHTTYGEKTDIIDQRYPATSASMFDSGNFVLYNHSDVIWESFSYTCDTILGGQELAKGKQLVSSESASQHSSGRFSLYMQYDGNLVAYPRNSSTETEDAYWSSGTFSTGYDSLYLSVNGSLHMVGYGEKPKVLNTPTRSSWSRSNETVVFRATLNPDGNFVLYSHIFTTLPSNLTRMRSEWPALQEPCKAKGICGVNSYCLNTGSKVECHCFPGFLFINESRNFQFLGCYRNFTDEEACSQRRPLKHSYNITAMENMELGVFPYSVMNLGKEDCSKSCLEDCNCWVALYANGSCKLLKVPIIYAVRNQSKIGTVFIKTSYPKVERLHSQLPAPTNLKQSVAVERKKLVRVIAITLGFLALMCTLMAFSSFFYYRVHARRYQSISQNAVDFELISDHSTLRSFSFDELQKATDGFKELIARNSIGEVYKGFISEGKKAVAVKKLHKMIFEGGGFRAEITAIAQTHHKNLVRLLGFCIHGATKMLVYEFMSNGSLADLLLTQPPFKERVRVALDVARGILYLHEECETRIIHCNIKPHNILFDESWTAKISDFGLSKLVRPNQNVTLTGVRGTRGYLAPEWLKNTLITTKVDIYSFGVLLLEIMCCTSDMEITRMSSDDVAPLSTWVYNCFVAKELSRLIGYEDGVDRDMFERMAKVGLLCIQDDQDARPSIKDVILMLEGTTDIPIPPSPTPLPLI